MILWLWCWTNFWVMCHLCYDRLDGWVSYAYIQGWALPGAIGWISLILNKIKLTFKLDSRFYSVEVQEDHYDNIRAWVLRLQERNPCFFWEIGLCPSKLERDWIKFHVTGSVPWKQVVGKVALVQVLCLFCMYWLSTVTCARTMCTTPPWDPHPKLGWSQQQPVAPVELGDKWSFFVLNIERCL